MFYRRLNDEQFTSVDLTGIYAGCPLFIIGGNPVIAELPLDLLEQSRLPTVALNNVLYTYPNPTIWLTADKPSCYGGHFFARPDITKIAHMDYRDEIVSATARPVKEHPMMMFYTTAETADYETFFDASRTFTWWKSVFPISLQLAWRLGVRRVYLVGCSFLTNQEKPYAWAAKLGGFQTKWSQDTYNDDMGRLERLLPLFKENGFSVTSCTPYSKANKLLPYVDLRAAINHELSLLPKPVPVGELRHSSDFRPTES
jgi:hypothetical protein